MQQAVLIRARLVRKGLGGDLEQADMADTVMDPKATSGQSLPRRRKSGPSSGKAREPLIALEFPRG